jgi:hypothetical protein
MEILKEEEMKRLSKIYKDEDKDKKAKVIPEFKGPSFTPPLTELFNKAKDVLTTAPTADMIKKIGEAVIPTIWKKIGRGIGRQIDDYDYHYGEEAKERNMSIRELINSDKPELKERGRKLLNKRLKRFENIGERFGFSSENIDPKKFSIQEGTNLQETLLKYLKDSDDTKASDSIQGFPPDELIDEEEDISR